MKLSPLSLLVDDRPLRVAPGTTILEAARSAGIDIPTLCHDPRLVPEPSCGLCHVEVWQGETYRVEPACATQVVDGMVVRTSSAELRRARRACLELLLSDHAADCVARRASLSDRDSGPPSSVSGRCPMCRRRRTSRDAAVPSVDSRRSARGVTVAATRCSRCTCASASTCALRRYAHEYGVDPSRVRGAVHRYVPVVVRPGVRLDMNKCIRCERCVRICRDVAHVGALSMIGRGFDARVLFAAPLDDEARLRCDDCAAGGALCIDTCPTGGLEAEADSARP